MLFEKNTLFGPLVLWFTGCSAVSPGHWPFCASASTSVPGAPVSSLVTGSQVLVLNPGVDIWAPVWVATALLWTSQPLAPRLVISEPPGLPLAVRTARVAALRPDRWLAVLGADNVRPLPACAVANEMAWVPAARAATAITERIGRISRAICNQLLSYRK